MDLKIPALGIEIVTGVPSAEVTGSTQSSGSSRGEDEEPIQPWEQSCGELEGSAKTLGSSVTTDSTESNKQEKKRQRDEPQESGKHDDDSVSSSFKKLRALDEGLISPLFKRFQPFLDYSPPSHSPKSLLGDLKGCIVNPEDVNITFEDIHITPDAIEALDAILLPLRVPDQFKVGILSKYPPTGLLLYGPPGTGKTLLVKALARKAEATILSVSGADIRSKYVGEGEKKIQKIFACARQWDGPFVIFIDEVDALFRSRSSGSNSRGHLDDLNQFLTEMDGISSSGLMNIMVVVATNRPFDIDEGILRRLGRRILVDVPNIDGREAILKIHLRDETLADDVNLAELAKCTYDYTGSDLRDLVYATALTAVRDRVNSPEQPAAQPRVLQNRHFLRAKKQIHASPKSDTMEKIREFHTKFGNTAQRSAGSVASSQIINKTKNQEICNTLK